MVALDCFNFLFQSCGSQECTYWNMKVSNYFANILEITSDIGLKENYCDFLYVALSWSIRVVLDSYRNMKLSNYVTNISEFKSDIDLKYNYFEFLYVGQKLSISVVFDRFGSMEATYGNVKLSIFVNISKTTLHYVNTELFKRDIDE